MIRMQQQFDERTNKMRIDLLSMKKVAASSNKGNGGSA